MPFVLRSDVMLDHSLETVFDFFSDAGNLEAITPPELRFRIRTPRPIEMRVGCLIEYELALYRIPFSWLTEISVWEPGVRFVDRQLRGPFSVWVHEHRFEAVGPDRTRVRDEVHYALPFEPLSRVVHRPIRAQLDRIFDHRRMRVAELLGG